MIGLIFQHLKDWNSTDMIINSDRKLSPFMKNEIRGILCRLEKGEPLQYILGESWFYGMLFDVNRHTLIPRPETGEMVDMIVDRYRDCSDLNILDVATGSGCIAISLARSLKFARVDGLDISRQALEVARRNALKLKAKVEFFCADINKYEPERDSYDIIVSNPPYVAESEKVGMDKNVLEWEPSSALFVPDDEPLVFYRRITDISMRGLRCGGSLYLEINPLFADDMKDLLINSGFEGVEILRDIHGRNRFAIGFKKKD